jgi:hypothetical protein
MGGRMNLLIRNVPEHVVAAIDKAAGRLGLPRSEYLRRRLIGDTVAVPAAPTHEDLAWFSETFADLDDPEVMAEAWR